VLYDAVGSFELPSAFVEELVAGGIETAEFNPVAPWRARFALNRRDHQKCLVVDDTVGFVGGLNVSDEYSPLEDGGQGWRDQAVRIEGPVVHDLSVNFRRTWLLARGRAFRPPHAAPAGDPAQGFASEVALVTNYVRRRLGLSGRAMNRSALHAIRKAERQVSIMSAYFIPGAAMRRALYRAVARGVDVRIVVPEVSDVRAAWYAGRHLYPGGAAAMTLGHVVLGVNRLALDETRDHERVHVRQVERWGPAFIPAYLFASVLAWWRGEDPYLDNHFEREAFGRC
jgi:cardiolipin synthase